jgi:hypothetical protein
MGVSLFARCSSSPYAVLNSNPDPEVFHILEEYTRGPYLVLWVRYPGCSNCEGMKVLVFCGYSSSKQLLEKTAGKLDPHFADRGVSPIARFPPTVATRELIDAAFGA